MPNVFSCTSITFDHEPYDSELTCLLGRRSWFDELRDSASSGIRCVETGGDVLASPRVLPIKWILAGLIVLCAIQTCFWCVVYVSHHSDPKWTAGFLVLVLLLIWLVQLPLVVGILFLCNRWLGRDGDYFRISGANRTLELCRFGRTVKAGEIIGFVELMRWRRLLRYVGGWHRTRQTSVMIRDADRRVELYPLIHERERELRIDVVGIRVASLPLRRRELPWADRLAGTFQVPVRRITLTKSESKALNDC
jgi:hypothetical protein